MEDLTKKKISRTMLRKHCKKLEEQVEKLLTTFPTDGAKKLFRRKQNARFVE